MGRGHHRTLLGIALALIAGSVGAQTTAPATPPPNTAPASAPGGAAPESPLVELLTRVQALQDDLREMRGQLEVESHDIDDLRQRQRDLYLDIDRRLRRLESGGAVASSPPPAPGGQTPGAVGSPTAAETGSAPAQSTADAAQEQAAYQTAFDTLKEGRYKQAIVQFHQFLKNYPDGNYSDNAQYWLGEANYVTRDFNQAIAEFRKVMSNFASSPKVPDALLKIGYSQYELHQWDQARKTLVDLVKRFPQSSAARLGEKRLERMKQEGH